MNYLPERTVKYKSHLKASMRNGLLAVFKAHPDLKLKTSADGRQHVNVTLEWPHRQDHFPAVVIRYYGRRIERMGVGHEEEIYIQDDDPVPTRMFHNIYEGDIELAVSALSSYDRDLVCDTLVQTVTMGVLETWTNHLLDVIYPEYTLPVSGEDDGFPVDGYPDSSWHSVAVNTDQVQEFGETQTPTPWGSEDEQLYNVSLRVGILGEFYSVPPSDTVTGGFVEQVDVYPWIKDIEDVPTGDPAVTTEWQPPENDPE